MSMDRKRVQMVRTDGSRSLGSYYLLPNAEANDLIAKGAAKLADQVGPSETKPMAPLQTKPAVVSEVKQPVTIPVAPKKNA